MLRLLGQFIGRKFIHLTNEEIETMIELAPLEETAMGKELIQQGMQQGIQQGVQAGQVEVIADLIEQKFGVPAAATVIKLASLRSNRLKN